MKPSPPTLSRRQLLALAAGSLCLGVPRLGLGAPSPEPFEVHDLVLPGDKRLGQRMTLLVPMAARRTAPTRLLVLLHGLGETGDPRAGAFAWLERYGLADAYRRLASPPIQRTSKLPYWPDGRVAELNALLATQPWRPPVVACPYTPDVYRAPSREAALDAYADWIVDVVLPRARAVATLEVDPARTSLDGCSLGGYVGLEVFLRKPEHFGAWGSVQGALGAQRVPRYAERIAELSKRLAPRPIHLETSDQDVFLEVNRSFSRALRGQGLAHDWLVGRGPHNQPWLREAGTLEMLLWHGRLP
jgi:predicted esterase